MLVRGEPAMSPFANTERVFGLMTGSDFPSLSKLSPPNAVDATHKPATPSIVKPQFHVRNSH